MAAPGHRLVSPTPQRPSQPESSLLFGRSHRQDHSPNLRYGRWDQLGIEILWVEIPPLAAPSSRSDAERITAKKAYARRQSVMCRCQPSHFLTSYSSRPTSPLAASTLSSMDQRLPAIWISSWTGVSAGP